MNDYQMANLLTVLERIAQALEASNALHDKPIEVSDGHGGIIQTAEQTERIIRVQEQDAETRKRQADAWEEHNLWHRQLGTMTEDHPKAH